MNENSCKLENNERRIRGAVLGNIFFMTMMSLKAISPYYSRNMSSTVFFLLFIGWLFCAFWITNWRIHLRATPIVVWSVVLIIWQVLMRIIGISTFRWGNYLFRIVLYGLPLMTMFIIKQYTRREKQLLLTLLLCVSLYNIIDNTVLWNTSRSSFVGLYYTSYVANRATNAGGTEFNAFCMFLLPTLFLIAFFSQKRISKVIGLSLLLLDIYAILYINPHATALLLSMIFIAMLICVYIFGQNKRRMYSMLIIVLLGILILYGLLPSLLRGLASIITKEEISIKINQVASILSGASIDGTTGSLASRWRMAWVSIDTFFENFMFGIGEHNVGQSLSDFESVGFGGHSELLDYLAKYGITGTFFLAMALYVWIRNVLIQVSSYRLRNITHIVWIMFIVYSFLNKSFKLELFVPIFVIYPLTRDLLCYNKFHENKNMKYKR